MSLLWILVVALVILGVYSAVERTSWFVPGAIIGLIVSIGLDVAYCHYFSGKVAGFAWMFIFWPDYMVRTMAIEEWGCTESSPVARIMGYAATGICYGSIAGTIHALKKKRNDATPQQQPDEEKTVISCEGCGQKLRVPVRPQNVRVRCGSCKREFDFQPTR